MKTVFAGLLLFFQLQPVLGTVACLGLPKQPQQECQMPVHGAVPHSTIAQAQTATPNCALASGCAPAPLAILSLADVPESIAALNNESRSTAAPTLFGISTAPPFNPPRA